MNNVSWFVYLSQVIPSISILLAVFGVITFIFGGVTLINALTNMHDGRHYPNTYAGYEDIGKKKISFVKKFVWVPVLLLTISVIIPSRNTMYMIAASQIGEQIIQLEEVQEIGGEAGGLAKDTIELLRQQIQEQLKGSEDAKSSSEPTEAD